MEISVVVPVYNAETTIMRCVNSILNQTLECLEIILIDDGSTDNSAYILDKLVSLHPKVHVFHINNQGVSHARNYGINKCSGRYVIFVDSDDFLTENALDILSQGGGGFSYFSIAKYNDDTCRIEGTITDFEKSHIKLNSKEGGEEIEKLDLLAVGFPYGKLFDLNIIRSNNLCFDERITNHEDHIFCFEYLLCVDSVYVENMIGYYWTYRSQRKSLSHTTPSYKNLLIASDAFLKLYPKLFMKMPYLSKAYKDRLTAEYGVGTRRAAIYSLYHNKETTENRIRFFNEQTPILETLLFKYGYHTRTLKHKLAFEFASLRVVPSKIKDLIFKLLYVAK